MAQAAIYGNLKFVPFSPRCSGKLVQKSANLSLPDGRGTRSHVAIRAAFGSLQDLAQMYKVSHPAIRPRVDCTIESLQQAVTGELSDLIMQLPAA